MLLYSDKPASANEIRVALEGNDPDEKIEAMEKAITMLLNGEQLPALFITIVRYVLPSEDHTVQKLLLLYLETIEKTDANGKLLPEMILICQNLRNNLQHPNEYLRGSTLRFLCRIREEEILEPLTPSILQCLDHRHSFVRRNAVLAINAMYKLPKGEMLLQDAPELIERVLQNEQDLSTRRNCFQFLTAFDQPRAINYLMSQVDNLPLWGGLLQLAVLDLIRKVCRSNPADKGKYIKIIVALLQSTNTAVRYECAVTLVGLSNAPTAIRAAANCYCELLVSQSDNNVMLIVLDRLVELKPKHREVLQDVLLDIMRALSTPNLDIRKKTLDLGMELVTEHNIDEVVSVLKKEIIKTQNKDLEKGADYRQLLVQAIHSCAVKFPAVAGNVLHLLMDFLGDPNTAAALDVMFFVREVMETNEGLRPTVLSRLLDNFSEIRSSRVATCGLWIAGEFAMLRSDIEDAIKTIKEALGHLPLVPEKGADGDEDDADSRLANGTSTEKAVPSSNRPAVLADGSYATQVAVASTFTQSSLEGVDSHTLRTLLLEGDFFLGSVIGVTLAKLVLRLRGLPGISPDFLNKTAAEALLICASIVRLGQSDAVPQPIDGASHDRLSASIKVLASDGSDVLSAAWREGGREAFAATIADKRSQLAEEAKTEEAKAVAQPDELVDFHHLRARRGLTQLEIEDQVATDLQRATGTADADTANHNRLNKVLQLTGFSDTVYAEAYITVHQYDIVLDVHIVNRTTATLQNLNLELATMGDLKLVERPQNHTLGPGASKTVRANIKVSSTETGAIFGNIVYEGTGAADRQVVVLSDIHIDILDYIAPAYVPDVHFRSMWAEFEWENKVAVNTTFTELRPFLKHIMASTNMRCLTPPAALDGDCGYLAANLYAKSVFGEAALVNVSVEKEDDAEGKLVGFIRIRSKTQGIALSLGDKLILKQKC